MSVREKCIIVTGGTQGIGAATACLLSAEGANVVVGGRDARNGQAVVERIRAAGGTASYASLDVTDESSATAAVELAVREFGSLDGLVNCAGTVVVGKISDLSAADWDNVMTVNCTGVFYMCKHSIRRFQEQGSGGAIVNVGSISAVLGLPRQAAYCASKGAILNLTRQIAVEYAREGIRCNTIGPGSTETAQLQKYLDEQPDRDQARQDILSAHPMGRVADPHEIAEAIAFLVSDRSSFVTGANLQVDGGYSAQ